MSYCKLNSISLQFSKFYFIVINGSEEDKEPFHLSDGKKINHCDFLEILGSPVYGNLKKDLDLHLKKRFKNVIKYYNYLRDNRIAPLNVKLKVLRACVVTTLLYNCETFGHMIPAGIEEIYMKLIKAAMNARQGAPNSILLIESGLLPIKALIFSRQLKFYKRFKSSIQDNSTRSVIFEHLMNNQSKYIKHYVDQEQKYTDSREIYQEFLTSLKNSIQQKNDVIEHYKHWIYIKLNPSLTPSCFLSVPGRIAQCIVKFRLGSHNLAIEKGRWRRIPRAERLCNKCRVIGDEYHLTYDCVDISRDDIPALPEEIGSIWTYSHLYKLFQRIIDSEYVDYCF